MILCTLADTNICLGLPVAIFTLKIEAASFSETVVNTWVHNVTIQKTLVLSFHHPEILKSYFL